MKKYLKQERFRQNCESFLVSKVVDLRTGRRKKVSWEYEDPRPQPLVNIVNKLIDLSQ
jgi:hypothetical protein